MTVNHAAAALNAGLTAASLACLALGWRAIRAMRIDEHRRWMIAASAFGAAFLVVFGARLFAFGMTPFLPSSRALRGLYYAVYLTHEPVAVINTALGAAALLLGLRGAYARHKEIAPAAFWTWAYAAASGLVIYALLYGPLNRAS